MRDAAKVLRESRLLGEGCKLIDETPLTEFDDTDKLVTATGLFLGTFRLVA